MEKQTTNTSLKKTITVFGNKVPIKNVVAGILILVTIVAVGIGGIM
jgi:hypothetical protein